MKKKTWLFSKIDVATPVYDWKPTKHNSFQKSAFQTLIFKSPKTDPQVLQKQQLNEATHSPFRETLGQTIETKKPQHHTNIWWGSFKALQDMIWVTNSKSKSKIRKNPWTYRRNCLPGAVCATLAGHSENLFICFFHFKRGDVKLMRIFFLLLKYRHLKIDHFYRLSVH